MSEILSGETEHVTSRLFKLLQNIPLQRILHKNDGMDTPTSKNDDNDRMEKLEATSQAIAKNGL